MAKINPQRLTTEEFPDQLPWIGKMFQPLNQFIKEVVNAFSNSFTIEDNLYQEIKEIKFVNSTTNFPLKFRTKFNAQPRGLVPIYIFNNTLGSYSTLAPFLVWSYANNEVTLSDISGLTSGETYTIRILAIYG